MNNLLDQLHAALLSRNGTEIIRIAEQIDGEYQGGKIVELPCRVGDTVYKTSYDCEKGIRYNPYDGNGYSTAEICLKCDVYPCDLHKAVITATAESKDWIWKNKSDFGKTVFLAREAAEQALKERET